MGRGFLGQVFLLLKTWSWPSSTLSPTAVGYLPTAVGYSPTAVVYPATAVGYPPSAVSYPPTAVGCTPTAIAYPFSAIGWSCADFADHRTRQRSSFELKNLLGMGVAPVRVK